MSYLSINGVDVSNLVSGLKVGYEVLVSEESGRNASGTAVIDVVAKKTKLYVTFRPMNGVEMAKLLKSFEDYVVNVSYRDSKTNATGTIKAYPGTAEPEYYWIHGNEVLYKSWNLNFIEL